MRGGKRLAAKLTYDEKLYNLYILKTIKPFTKKEMRKEYTRLRNIVNKRLDRMKGTSSESSRFYKRYQKAFRKSALLLSENTLMYKLSEVAGAFTSKEGTRKKQKAIVKKSLKTLQESGYAVNQSNIEAFGEFMEEYRQQKLDLLYSSEQAASLFEALDEKDIKPSGVYKHFEQWIEKRKELEKMDKKIGRTGRGLNASKYRKALGIK